MNKKGFTLIELLMVIALIAIISMILVPNVVNMINRNKVESCENLKKNIISATKIYVNENKYDLGFTCASDNDTSTVSVSVKTLIDAGKLSGDIKDPIKGKDLSAESVKVTFKCKTKQFQYVFEYGCE